MLLLFPFITDNKKKAWALLSVFLSPHSWDFICFAEIFNISHFITSRYFITFLPLFLVTLYLSIEAIEKKIHLFQEISYAFSGSFSFYSSLRTSSFFPSITDPKSRTSEVWLDTFSRHLRKGDIIYLGGTFFYPGIFHYFGIFPKDRHYELTTYQNPQVEMEFVMTSLSYKNVTIPVYYSKRCCSQYVVDGNRLWIVVGGKRAALEIMKDSPAVLKGYFDGSFVNFNRFPTDASIYLFLWDPKSPEEKGIDMPIE